LLYSTGKVIFKIIIKILFKVRVSGTEFIPEHGGLVVCGNHYSWWDPVILACVMDRPVCFVAKKELFRNKIFAFLLYALNAFPVDREKPDIKAIRNALSILKQGKVLGIFPEGSRQKDLSKLGNPHGGAALFAIRSNSLVQPVALRGKYGFRKQINVAFGKPFMIESKTGKINTDLAAASQMIMSKIGKLWKILDPGVIA
jgi:1-acyl-sn-glycerol-3-phosphate acyltransferase